MLFELLSGNPLLLLFLVAALGYSLGEIRVKGSSLGPAAVLFVGLAVGAVDPRLKLPDVITSLGLTLFVYTVGLSNGSSFFASFRRKGIRDSLFVVCNDVSRRDDRENPPGPVVADRALAAPVNDVVHPAIEPGLSPRGRTAHEMTSVFACPRTLFSLQQRTVDWVR